MDSPSETMFIRVLAQWKSFTPDVRQYKPSTPVIEFVPEPLVIAVDVPLQSDLVKNAEVIVAAQLTNQAEPKAHFTPMGMRYIIDQFEAVMKNGKPQEAEEEEFVPTGKPKEPSTSEDDEDWGDEDDTDTKSDKDENWDENWEDD